MPTGVLSNREHNAPKPEIVRGPVQGVGKLPGEPDISLRTESIGLVGNNFVNDIFERIAAEASRLAHYNKRSITGEEVQKALRQLLPEDLTKGL